jgi:hypothetical protein
MFRPAGIEMADGRLCDFGMTQETRWKYRTLRLRARDDDLPLEQRLEFPNQFLEATLGLRDRMQFKTERGG